MGSKNDLQLAYGLAVILFIVGVISYAASSAIPPDPPYRMMYKTAAGKVLFDHQTHAMVDGLAISCGDCHHTLSEDEYDQVTSCSECHEAESHDESVPARTDAIHQQCIDCHKEYEAGPVECSSCHVL